MKLTNKEIKFIEGLSRECVYINAGSRESYEAGINKVDNIIKKIKELKKNENKNNI